MAQVTQKQKMGVGQNSLNKVESKTFIKKMLAIGISNITYLRNLFPESAFSDRTIEDLPLKILKEHSHEGAGRVVQWMKGVYDAVELEYLRALIFAIVKDPEDPASVIESYTFGFTYDEGSVQASVTIGEDPSTKTNIPTKAQTKESAKQLLRNLVLLTSSMDKLPPNVFMTVRLLYYDQKTPNEYQPPGFIEAIETDTLGFVFDNVRIRLGHVVTPHTCMKVRVRAERGQFEPKEGVGDENPQPKLDFDDSQLDCMSQTTSIADPHTITSHERDCLREQLQNQEKVEREKAEFFQKNSQESVRNEDIPELGVRCPCLDPDNDGVMIMCSKCFYWQHAICFCLPDNSKVPESHLCHLCSDENVNICTDPRLTGLEKHIQQETCAWRRTLQACLDSDKVTVASISAQLSCSRVLAQKMISKLIEERIAVVSKGQRQTKLINHETLQVVFEREINHVSRNLSSQRNEISDQMQMSSPAKKKNYSHNAPNGKKLNLSTDEMITNDASMEELAFERKRPLRTSPLNSQSSMDAFKTNVTTNSPTRARKRRKISKIRNNLR